MRKHDVRKWLHACLDLLPVFLIPVFMIYSHRHDVTIQYENSVDYVYVTNEVESISDIYPYRAYDCNELVFNNNSFGSPTHIELDFYILQCSGFSFDYDDSYVDEYYTDNYSASTDNYIRFVCDFNYQTEDYILYVYYTNDNSYVAIYYTDVTNFRFNDCTFYINQSSALYWRFMFRNGDYLPVASTFNVIRSVETDVDKSDIMSVFMDSFNNAIDKYFNMGNVFNLGDIYDWFNTNIFGGNAPTIIYSIWNIALYEFVMDLLFLLYGLFMWFIDMIENVMNKPFKSVK